MNLLSVNLKADFYLEMIPILQINNLTITLKKDLRTILKDFSFALNPGDKVVVIGEEGNGKSTLMALLYDARLIEAYAQFTGKITKSNVRLGYLKQELSQQQKAESVCAFCAQLPGFQEVSQRELSKIASQLGLSSALFSSSQAVGDLSGGEKVKLQLAGLLMDHPDVLLLDEPSNDLDIETLEWLERFIASCPQPVLFISHDETLIEKTANVIIHMEQLRRKTVPRVTVQKMPYRQYVQERLSKLSHQEQLARKEKSEYDAKQRKFRQIEARVAHEQNAISRGDPHGGRLLKKKMKAVKSLERRFEKEHENRTQLPDTEEAIWTRFGGEVYIPNGKTVLDFALDKLVAGGRVLSENVKLRVMGPEKICIVGENGAGKTTLLKAVSDHLLARTDVKAAYMPQSYEDLLDFSQTPVEYLCVRADKEEMTKIRTFLGSMKFTADEMEHKISDLSGGQKAKLLFEKMVLDGSNVLILDEPTRNLSPISGPVVREALRAYGGAIISVSHDRKYISEVCTKVYRLTKSGLESL